MKLTEWTARKPGRVSVVDQLPPAMIDQLVAARAAGTHSVGSMVDWLAHEGHPEVTVSALNNWFATRGHPHGSSRGVA